MLIAQTLAAPSSSAWWPRLSFTPSHLPLPTVGVLACFLPGHPIPCCLQILDPLPHYTSVLPAPPPFRCQLVHHTLSAPSKYSLFWGLSSLRRILGSLNITTHFLGDKQLNGRYWGGGAERGRRRGGCSVVVRLFSAKGASYAV